MDRHRRRRACGHHRERHAGRARARRRRRYRAAGEGPRPGLRRDHHHRPGGLGRQPLPGRPALQRPHGRRRLLHHLHLRHHGPPQGRRAHPPQRRRHPVSRGALPARSPVGHQRAPAAVPAAGTRLRPLPPAAVPGRRGRAGPHPRRQDPPARPAVLRSLLHPGRPARPGEDLQRRRRQGRQRRQAQAVPLGRQGRHRLLPRSGHPSGPLPRPASGARHGRPSRLPQDPGTHGAQCPFHHLRRRAAGAAPGALLPRPGPGHPGGLRPDRDHRPGQRQHRLAQQDRHRRSARLRQRDPHR